MNEPRHRSEHPSLLGSQLEEIDQLCGAFEAEWQAGAHPKIEDYLNGIAAPLVAALLSELIALEIDLRQADDEHVNLNDYHRRFPSDRAAVEAGWALIADREAKDEEVQTTFKVSKDANSDTGDNTPETNASVVQSDKIPSHIGRYQILDLLGEGGFGRVYLADDTQLRRHVALKVPRRRWLSSEVKLHTLLHEAQSAARLKHPALVAVYDVQQDGDDVYIVQEYVDGHDLSQWVKSDQPSCNSIIRVIVEIVHAVGFAHQHDLVHRDLKPGNILIDRDGHAHVADFGLALHESAHWSRKGEVSGTPAYMSPEQVRGETHLTDGRSDLWSIGVILYELLAGRRPFRGDTQTELFYEITQCDPKPVRQIKPEIGPELERICLKCLERRRTARYCSAAELAEDLDAWLQPPPEIEARSKHAAEQHDITHGAQIPPRVVPKGLRSFDAHDADFFLQLLPGPRDRNGLPDSIRFWKTRIEQTDPDGTFSVGLLYGPSGCGKSSLVKAGLLPHLASHVTPIYLEATPEETEVHLIKGLRRHVSGIPDDVQLPELLAGLRNGRWMAQDQKILIVLDQFEQWLHARRGEQDTQLVQALRQCDGGRLQCVVLVRDDFWLAASHFMQDIETHLLEGENCALVDLFDPLHARKVLVEFGRAYGRLPGEAAELSKGQSLFLDRAVNGLVRDSKIICVRLALFADMLKGKPWNTTTLAQVGGTEGLGVTFLEETFSASTAPAAHRYHQKATQAVLKALVPETGTAIKGSRRSYADLVEASGYGSRKRDFQDLIRILDTEIRLITPTFSQGEDIDADDDSRGQAESGQKYYQLTHDYLVPSLRDWLTRKQKATHRGRAELRLEEQAALWKARPENRHLPKAWEDLYIRLFSRRGDWTETQREMMRKSGRLHGIRTLVVAVLISVAAATGLKIRKDILAERQRIATESIEKQNATRASGLVAALMKANIQQVPTIVNEMRDLRPWIDVLLKREYSTKANDSPEKLRLALALLPTDSSQVDYLYNRLLTAAPNEVLVVRDALLPHKKRLIARLWTILQEADRVGSPEQLRAACGLAVMDGRNAQWQQVADHVVRQVIHVRPAFVAYWQQALQPVKDALTPSLAAACRDPALTSTERTLATDLLADYAADSPKLLASVIQYADDSQFSVFFPLIEAEPTAAIPVLESCLAKTLTFDWQDPPLDPAWKTPDVSVIQKIQDAQGELADRFAFCQIMPLKAFQSVAESLRTCGYRPVRIRPYSTGKDIRLAAIWTRDDRPWQMKMGTAADILAEDKRLQADKWRVADIAGVTVRASDGKSSLQFTALWTQTNNEAPARQLLIGMSSEQWAEVHQQLDKAGFKQMDRYDVLTTPEGKTRISVIASKADRPSTLYDKLGFDYSGERHLALLQTDVGIGRVSKPKSTYDFYTQRLQDAEKKLLTTPDSKEARFQRAEANYRLGADERSLEDLDWLISKNESVSVLRLFQALAFARMDKREEAGKALAKFLELSNSDAEKAFADMVVATYLGTDDKAGKRLEEGLANHEKDPTFLIWAASAYSVASATVDDVKKRDRCAARAVELVEKAIAAGYDDYAEMRTAPDLDPIHTHPGFVKLLKRHGLDRRYTALWRESTTFQSTEVHGLSPADQLARCKQLMDQGYRPASIAAFNFRAVRGSPDPARSSTAGLPTTSTAVQEDPVPRIQPTEDLKIASSPSAIPGALRSSHGEVRRPAPSADEQPAPSVRDTRDTQNLVTATVWHRPLIPEELKEVLAKRQANAAVTLLKLNILSPVWPVLRHSPDPRGRSYLIHRVRPLQVDLRILSARLLDSSEDISARRALALCLGAFDLEQLPLGERDQFVKALMETYRDHPDAGFHAAVRWLLCQWGFRADVLKLDGTLMETERQLVARKPIDRRQWYVAKQGPTMVMIQGGPFLMGSPLTDPGRNFDETLHRKNVGRRFALSATEVTRGQWRRFVEQTKDKNESLLNNPHVTAVVRTEDSPMVGLPWYESAAYCNWLSDQEGIAQDQWCYVRNAKGKFAAGMRPKPNYLLLHGYRLPSEAEWEYACRAGATTVYYFGQTDDLLPQYAWYKVNSMRRTWPVGSLKPNDFGLFDMHGSVWNWCHNLESTYGGSREDAGDVEVVQDSEARTERGGSFSDPAPLVRSAIRSNDLPRICHVAVGFRVARTLP